MNTGDYATTHSINLTQRIMRRVYFYWFMRRVAPTLLGQLAVLSLLLVGIHEYVSIRFVVQNAMGAVSGLPSLVNFAASAFRNTGFVPQILFGAVVLLGFMTFRDVLKLRRGMPRGQLELIRR